MMDVTPFNVDFGHAARMLLNYRLRPQQEMCSVVMRYFDKHSADDVEKRRQKCDKSMVAIGHSGINILLVDPTNKRRRWEVRSEKPIK